MGQLKKGDLGNKDQPKKGDVGNKKSVSYSSPTPPPKAASPMQGKSPAGGGGGERRVHLNDDAKNEEEAATVKQGKGEFVAGNAVRTSKYTLYTLLPLNLSEQFSKLANIYFLIISLLQVLAAYC